ncbi:MAG TPA: ABC transporter substrate-binding protein [Candidatus Limnocylindrales bacterium]|nr:ABC transporter substrate-binding protein [Candidatus Limnocylindrales bacterium]
MANGRRYAAGLAALAIAVGACTGTSPSASTAPSSSAAASSSAPSVGESSQPSASPSAEPSLTGSDYGTMTPLKPAVDLGSVGGQGEGALNLIIWAGYAEDGSNQKAYDWVHPFEDATGCKVTTKPGNTSDEMVTLMRQGGGSAYDGVSASGDATLRLIANGDVAAIDPAQIPGFGDVAPFLQDAPHYVVNDKHYGVPHGWGGNSLMYRTDKVSPKPTSWDVVFDPDKSKPYAGKITDYDSPIYLADAALYLKAHNPELGITDPYELNQEQFDAAVELLHNQRPNVGKYWSLFSDEIDNFKNGTTVVGTTWPYQVNALKGESAPVDAVVPSEGMTGWADTWMMSAHAQHPNCMLKWMAWMITPEVQAQVAENFGEAPANPKACKYLDPGYGPYAFKDFCTLFSVNDPTFYDQIAFWKTPLADCGDERGTTCIDYSVWTQKWTEIKG